MFFLNRPNHNGIQILMKNNGKIIIKNVIKNRDRYSEYWDSDFRKMNFIMNIDDPGKPIVVITVKNEAYHNWGRLYQILAIFHKSLEWKRLLKHSTRKNSAAIVKE
jgi:hypothetical protein